MLLDKYTKLVNFNAGFKPLNWSEGDYLVTASHSENRSTNLLSPGGSPIPHSGSREYFTTHEFKAAILDIGESVYYGQGHLFRGSISNNLYDSVFYVVYDAPSGFIYYETHDKSSQILSCNNIPLIVLTISEGKITNLIFIEISFNYSTEYIFVLYNQTQQGVSTGARPWGSPGKMDVFLDNNSVVKHNVLGALYPSINDINTIPVGYRSHSLTDIVIYDNFGDLIRGRAIYSRFSGETPLSNFGLSETSFFIKNINNSTPFLKHIPTFGNYYNTYRNIPFNAGDFELSSCLANIHNEWGGELYNYQGPEQFYVFNEVVDPGDFQGIDRAAVEGAASSLIGRVQNEMQRFFARNGQYDDVYVYFIPTALGTKEFQGKVTFFGGNTITSAEGLITYIFNSSEQPPSITFATISWNDQPYLPPVKWGDVFNSLDPNLVPYSIDLIVNGVALTVAFSTELLIPAEVYDPQIHVNLIAKHLLVKAEKFNVFTEGGNVLTVSGDGFNFDASTESCETDAFTAWAAAHENPTCESNLTEKLENLLNCYRFFFSTYVVY